MGNHLYQFQCQKEGTLFYYQHGCASSATMLVERCPVCGSRRVELIRAFPPVEETGGPEVVDYRDEVTA